MNNIQKYDYFKFNSNDPYEIGNLISRDKILEETGFKIDYLYKEFKRRNNIIEYAGYKYERVEKTSGFIDSDLSRITLSGRELLKLWYKRYREQIKYSYREIYNRSREHMPHKVYEEYGKDLPSNFYQLSNGLILEIGVL